MVEKSQSKADVEKAVDIIRDAGGEVIGRTRLQKIGYLLEATGLGDGFRFEYHRYGPYSEELAVAVRTARLLGLVDEKEYVTSWGGLYSVFKVPTSASPVAARAELIRMAAAANPVELELAATAAFLFREGNDDPWEETAKRKPEKSDSERLDRAKALYKKLSQVNTPVSLPAIV
jgi:hypothetical protein